MPFQLESEVHRIKDMLDRSLSRDTPAVRALLRVVRELLELHTTGSGSSEPKSVRRHRQVSQFRGHRLEVQAMIRRYGLTERQLRFLSPWRESPLFPRLVHWVGELGASSRKVQAWAVRLKALERAGPLDQGQAYLVLAALCGLELNSAPGEPGAPTRRGPEDS